ncbi:MAG: BatA and WFA domain-containing protein [Bryobacteraceae bacterium]|nr:BatA and WFA domain-containing protein [Bryobacteraceae bacterium]
MFLFNLSLIEFMALLSGVSAAAVALYLLDRSRRRQKVPTLRFWVSAQQPVAVQRRRRIQQPWSLVLQLISMALLLLAIAQLKWGSPDRTSRDHVLLLDTSAWMQASVRGTTLMEAARSSARAWLNVLPAGDRVMLVRADALASPATAFEADRDVVLKAIRESAPGASSLDLEQALSFASHIQKLHAQRPGEIVLVSTGRVSSASLAGLPAMPANLRLLPVRTEVENIGLRKIGLRRSPGDADLWEIFISVRNYGSRPVTVPLALQFGGAPAGRQTVSLPPGLEQNVTFSYRTRAGGWLEARLLSGDAFPRDDQAVFELPEQRPVRVVVYSDAPELLRPLLAASPHVEATFRSPAQYQPKPEADIAIIDAFRPPEPPQVETIWIEPPAGAGPIARRATVEKAAISHWKGDHPLGRGLRTRGVKLERAQIFSPQDGDVAVAETDAGPVILARPSKPRAVALGFHPMKTDTRYELTAPLLFANMLLWMKPDVFRRWELNAGTVGTVTAVLDADVDPKAISIKSDDGRQVPYTMQDRNLRFFVGSPATLRLAAGDRELVYSLTLPDVPDAVWQPAATVKRGVPKSYPPAPGSKDLWQWLAVLGAVGLGVEWAVWGRRRQAVSARSPVSTEPPAASSMRRAS